jgi:hypothetical protein
MENQEEPSVLTLLTDFDTENHGLDVMRIALHYQVSFEIFTILEINQPLLLLRFKQVT